MVVTLAQEQDPSTVAMLHIVIPSINTEVLLKESVFAIYYLLQEAFRDAMTAHSAQLTKMRLPDRAIMLKAVSKAKNPILVKRKKMFKLGLVRDSLFCFFSLWQFVFVFHP